MIGNRCIVINVGDSRAYRVGSDEKWQIISRNHTALGDLRGHGQASRDQDYANMYDALDSCLIADD